MVAGGSALVDGSPRAAGPLPRPTGLGPRDEPGRAGTSPTATVSLPARILIVRLGAIGDVVNALVFAAAIKERAPGAHVGWAVHELARPLVEGNPVIDRVHLWRREGGARGFLKLVREVRAEGYELAVDLQRITKSALLARLSGARRVLGFDRARAKELSWLWTRERIAPGDPGAHMVAQYLEVARHLGCAVERPRHPLPAEAGAATWAEELVGELGAQPLVLGIGASKPANRWPPERWGALGAASRRELGLPVCLVGAPQEAEAARRALRSAGDGAGVRDLVGRTSLLQLAALEASARLFVGCDSGPMHLAAALGTPVVALFGPADPRRTGPFGDGHRVVRVPPPCAPCNLKRCDQPRHACMEDISVEHVLEAVRRTLARPEEVR